MENKNFACRIFKEQIELILQLPENERAEVLYKSVLFGFNQIDCQFDNQNENQNESAYVSVSDSVSILSNKIFNLLKKNITWKEFSNNYGGSRKGAGAPKGNTNAKKNNQIDYQNDIQNEKANETSVFHVDCQNFDEIPADILPVMKKYWTDEKIEKIRQDLAFMPSHDSCVATLLTKYDSDLLKQEPKSKATRFVKPTVEEVKAYCEERNNGVDPNDFVNHYDSKGWMIGKSPMKDWKAAVRTWESRNRKPTGSTNVNFAELVMLWNIMAERLNLDKVDESDLMPERKAEIEKIIAIKKPKDLKTMFAQLEKIISDSPKLRGWHDILGADGHWITKQLNWKANFAFCFSTKGWCDIMGGKYNGDVE